MLMQQRNGPDQRQIFAMIAPRAGLVVHERQPLGIRVHHLQRLYEPLRIAVQSEDCRTVFFGGEASQRFLEALARMDGAGLVAALIDGQHQAAVFQLLVEVDRGRRHHQGHRAFDAIFLGDQLSRGGVLARARNGERPLALQQLQRIGGMARALLLGDGQRLVLEVSLADVKEALAGHRRVGDTLLLRHEIEDRIHQRALARRRGRLDQHSERAVELARQRRKIGRLRIGLFADDADRGDVSGDTLKQARRLQPGKRCALLGRTHRWRSLLPRLRRLQSLVLHGFELEQHQAEIALHYVQWQGELERCFGCERTARLGGEEVEAVDMEGLSPIACRSAHHQIDLETLHARIAREAPRPPHPVAQPDHHVALTDLGFRHRLRARPRRDG